MKEVNENWSIDYYNKDKERVANTYVMKCFFVSMVTYGIAFLLNLMDIFIIDKRIILMGFIPSIIVYLMMLFIVRRISLSSPKAKYIILFCSVTIFTFIGSTITYHVVIMSFLPFLYPCSMVFPAISSTKSPSMVA